MVQQILHSKTQNRSIVPNGLTQKNIIKYRYKSEQFVVGIFESSSTVMMVMNFYEVEAW